jgi:hypothetical protein
VVLRPLHGLAAKSFACQTIIALMRNLLKYRTAIFRVPAPLLLSIEGLHLIQFLKAETGEL